MTTIIVRSRDSLLTTSSGYTNYRGILNLVIILLVLSNARAALENIIKYGILVDPLSWILFLAEGSKHWPALAIMLVQVVHILVSLSAERVIALGYLRKKVNKEDKEDSRWTLLAEQLAKLTIIVNLIACLALPPVVVYARQTHPISTSGALLLVSIVCLKLVSYHQMNYWCRDLRKPERQQSVTTRAFLRSYVPPAVDFGAIQIAKAPSSPAPATPTTPATPPPTPKSTTQSSTAAKTNGSAELRQRTSNANSNSNSNNNHNNHSNNNVNQTPKDQSKAAVREITIKTLARYPENVNLWNMCQYMMFPTLCYELEFARTERIRKRFLIKRSVELLILSQLDIALVQQWIVPTVSNSVLPFRKMQFSYMLERLLKLAIPNHVIWLIWFYLFFHSLLNIVAELLRFADREFYRDWWNSESVYYFWSNWNIPVHKWCTRHLYVPLMALGLNRCQASTAVFFVSAFFHEYLVSVPLKMFRMWAFTGMLMQLPWARFVSSYFNSHYANVAVWVSLIIGQPLCILMYYHDYYVDNIAK